MIALNKENAHRFLYLVSILLLVVFFITLGMDMVGYNDYIGSAPRYAYVLVRAVEFLLPSLAIFAVAIFLRRKRSKKDRMK